MKDERPKFLNLVLKNSALDFLKNSTSRASVSESIIFEKIQGRVFNYYIISINFDDISFLRKQQFLYPCRFFFFLRISTVFFFENFYCFFFREFLLFFGFFLRISTVFVVFLRISTIFYFENFYRFLFFENFNRFFFFENFYPFFS